MKFFVRILTRFIPALLTGIFSLVAAAQTPPTAAFEFIPAQPSSADTIFLKIPRTCATSQYLGPGYRTSAIGGKIRVELFLGPPPPCAQGVVVPALLVEIGRLPAGSYSLDIIDSRLVNVEVFFTTVASNVPFTVSDHRASKTAPAVRLNYSDLWWDPNNSGSGIFVWQDARDQLLAGWFTYGADGKAAWYTVQSGDWVSATRYVGKLVQTRRPPALNGQIDASGNTSLIFVGNATLDFSGDDGALAGVLTYKFDNADSAQTRNIRRFGK
jgi:hypothetical protein